MALNKSTNRHGQEMLSLPSIQYSSRLSYSELCLLIYRPGLSRVTVTPPNYDLPSSYCITGWASIRKSNRSYSASTIPKTYMPTTHHEREDTLRKNAMYPAKDAITRWRRRADTTRGPWLSTSSHFRPPQGSAGCDQS